MPTALGPFSLERVVTAVERVRERLLRATRALDAAGVPYAVAGGNAVAAWVSRVDEAAVRFTQDVDILVRRVDLDRVRSALEPAGFVYRHVANLDIFLDGPDAKPRDAVHLVFACERLKPHEPAESPDVTEAVRGEQYSVVTLEALVRIKLTAYRDKDRTHLRDLIDVGLLDHSWLQELQPVLAERLKQILDNPEG